MRHAALLWILLALFCFRVVAQLAVAVAPLPFLPSFEAWHSGALPYPVLVACQLLIVALYAWMARGIGSGRTRPDSRLARCRLSHGRLKIQFGPIAR